MAITLNDNIFTDAPKASDSRYGTYTSLANALSSVSSDNRYQGLTVGVIIDGVVYEYWFRDGVADEDLVSKQPDISELDDLNVNGTFTNYNKNLVDIGQVQTSDLRGYGNNYVSEKTLAYVRLSSAAFDEEGAVRIKNNVFQTYMDGAWQDVVTNFRFREDENGEYELEHKPIGFEWWIEVNSGNSDNLGLNGLPIVQNYKVSMGAYPVPLEIDGGTF